MLCPWVGVERDIAVLQEFLIPGVLWGYFECIHFFGIHISGNTRYLEMKANFHD